MEKLFTEKGRTELIKAVSQVRNTGLYFIVKVQKVNRSKFILVKLTNENVWDKKLFGLVQEFVSKDLEDGYIKSIEWL